MTLDYICKICGKSTVNNNGLISHVSQIHGFSSKQYYDLYVKSENDGICENCGKPTRFIKFSRGYARFCSRSCTAMGTVNERREIRYQKYGHFFSEKGADHLKQQAKRTAHERFGKILNDLKEKYNVTEPITNLSQIPEIKHKIKDTTRLKYGVNNNFLVADDTGLPKRIWTCLNKYHAFSPLQNADIQQKWKNTCLAKYGYENPNQCPDIREKSKATNLARYGVEYPITSENFRHKTYAKYRYDGTHFDSSWEIAYYIYLSDHHVRFKYHATTFAYYSPTDNKWHVYECDFTLFNHTYVEIKGGHLYNEMINDKMSKNYYKYLCMIQHNVHIITDASKYISYVKQKYGSNYLRKFRNKTQARQ